MGVCSIFADYLMTDIDVLKNVNEFGKNFPVIQYTGHHNMIDR